MAKKSAADNKANEAERNEAELNKAELNEPELNAADTSEDAAQAEDAKADVNSSAEDQTPEPDTVDKKKYDELYDKYLRTLAEYDNFKKRSQKEKDELYSVAVADTIEKLLPVADNLDRAISTLREDETSEFSEGVKMVSKQFFDILKKMGVVEIEALGAQFDPNIHNAVMHVDDDEYDANVVIEQFMKGYKYKEKVIRHSMVKVAN